MYTTILFLMMIILCATKTVAQEYTTDANTVLLLHFNETNGSTVSDASGNNNSGTSNGTTITNGRFGKARSFNGTSDYIDLGQSNSFSWKSNSIGTFEVWVYPTSLTTRNLLFSVTHNSNTNCGGRFRIGIDTAKKFFYEIGVGTGGCQSAIYTGTSTLLANKWYHLAVSYNGSIIKMYINGVNESFTYVEDGIFPTAPWFSAFDDGVTQIGTIGAETYQGTTREKNFSGIIDEVRISNIARTSFNIPSLVAYYPFNGNANDESGNENNGTVSGATLTTDRFGNANSAYSFNGSSNYMDVNTSFSNYFVKDFTAIVWFKMNVYNPNQRNYLLDYRGSSSLNQNSFALIIDNDSKIHHYVDWPSGGHAEYNTLISSPLNAWHHTVLVKQGTTLKAYYDGVQIANSFMTSDTSKSDSISLSNGAKFGYRSGPSASGDYWFNGVLDEVRIYNRALSASEVDSLYHLNGWDVQSFVVSPSSVSFGSVSIGTNKTDSVIVSNSGSGTLSISNVTSSNSQFTVSPTSATVNANSSQIFYITFAPTSSGATNGDIIFTHNATGSPDTVTVNGTGAQLTITATSGSNGSISPSGTININYGADTTFNFTANTGYHVDSVIVDGVKVDSLVGYTFTNVIANHTIQVTFAIYTFTISTSASGSGSISPSGNVVVNYGTSIKFTNTPNSSCYKVDSVLVDGVFVDSLVSYTFNNVTANHSIRSVFKIKQYTITATAGNNGSIFPSGSVTVVCGGEQRF